MGVHCETMELCFALALGSSVLGAPPESALGAQPGDAAPSAPDAPDSPQDMAQARALYESLEYESVLPLTDRVIADHDAPVAVRLDAYFLKGASLAILGNPVDAEKPFRYLLRGKPDYDLPANTSPRILAVFRKVQSEELAIIAEMKQLERRRIIASIALDSELPEIADGGWPLAFDVRLRDPRAAVSTVQLQYRRRGEPHFSSLALKADVSGWWRAELPGKLTESDDGFMLEYFVVTRDDEGRLMTVGREAAPLHARVAAGHVHDAVAIYERWWFWAGATAIAAGIAVGTFFAIDAARIGDPGVGVYNLPTAR